MSLDLHGYRKVCTRCGRGWSVVQRKGDYQPLAGFPSFESYVASTAKTNGSSQTVGFSCPCNKLRRRPMNFWAWLRDTHPDVRLLPWQEEWVQRMVAGTRPVFYGVPKQGGKTFIFTLWCDYCADPRVSVK